MNPFERPQTEPIPEESALSPEMAEDVNNFLKDAEAEEARWIRAAKEGRTEEMVREHNVRTQAIIEASKVLPMDMIDDIKAILRHGERELNAWEEARENGTTEDLVRQYNERSGFFSYLKEGEEDKGVRKIQSSSWISTVAKKLGF